MIRQGINASYRVAATGEANMTPRERQTHQKKQQVLTGPQTDTHTHEDVRPHPQKNTHTRPTSGHGLPMPPKRKPGIELSTAHGGRKSKAWNTSPRHETCEVAIDAAGTQPRNLT